MRKYKINYRNEIYLDIDFYIGYEFVVKWYIHGGCDRSKGDAFPSQAPDPTSGMSGGPCQPIYGTGLTADVTFGQGILTPPRQLIPILLYPGVGVSPFISLICNSYLCFETDHSLVSYPFNISYRISRNLSEDLI
jgi:hypothetical protein